jgi:hypothetical protein
MTAELAAKTSMLMPKTLITAFEVGANRHFSGKIPSKMTEL